MEYEYASGETCRELLNAAESIMETNVGTAIDLCEKALNIAIKRGYPDYIHPAINLYVKVKKKTDGQHSLHLE